jgi:hypothetical protein
MPAASSISLACVFALVASGEGIGQSHVGCCQTHPLESALIQAVRDSTASQRRCHAAAPWPPRSLRRRAATSLGLAALAYPAMAHKSRCAAAAALTLLRWAWARLLRVLWWLLPSPVSVSLSLFSAQAHPTREWCRGAEGAGEQQANDDNGNVRLRADQDQDQHGQQAAAEEPGPPRRRPVAVVRGRQLNYLQAASGRLFHANPHCSPGPCRCPPGSPVRWCQAKHVWC